MGPIELPPPASRRPLALPLLLQPPLDLLDPFSPLLPEDVDELPSALARPGRPLPVPLPELLGPLRHAPLGLRQPRVGPDGEALEGGAAGGGDVGPGGRRGEGLGVGGGRGAGRGRGDDGDASDRRGAGRRRAAASARSSGRPSWRPERLFGDEEGVIRRRRVFSRSLSVASPVFSRRRGGNGVDGGPTPVGRKPRARLESRSTRLLARRLMISSFATHDNTRWAKLIRASSSSSSPLLSTSPLPERTLLRAEPPSEVANNARLSGTGEIWDGARSGSGLGGDGVACGGDGGRRGRGPAWATPPPRSNQRCHHRSPHHGQSFRHGRALLNPQRESTMSGPSRAARHRCPNHDIPSLKYGSLLE